MRSDRSNSSPSSEPVPLSSLLPSFLALVVLSNLPTEMRSNKDESSSFSCSFESAYEDEI
jgi:hypothetical protein